MSSFFCSILIEAGVGSGFTCKVRLVINICHRWHPLTGMLVAVFFLFRTASAAMPLAGLPRGLRPGIVVLRVRRMPWRSSSFILPLLCLFSAAFFFAFRWSWLFRFLPTSGCLNVERRLASFFPLWFSSRKALQCVRKPCINFGRSITPRASCCCRCCCWS